MPRVNCAAEAEVPPDFDPVYRLADRHPVVGVAQAGVASRALLAIGRP